MSWIYICVKCVCVCVYVCLEWDIKLHPVARLQFWCYEECSLPLHCH